jgi:hypothetical protein
MPPSLALFQPRFGSWSRGGHPNRKDQKDFKDEKKVTFKVSGFAAIKSIPLNGLLDTFFRLPPNTG